MSGGNISVGSDQLTPYQADRVERRATTRVTYVNTALMEEASAQARARHREAPRRVYDEAMFTRDRAHIQREIDRVDQQLITDLAAAAKLATRIVDEEDD